MQRYHIGFSSSVDGWTIWDHKLGRFIGDGKGRVLALDSQYEAMEIVDIMVQRVGA